MITEQEKLKELVAKKPQEKNVAEILQNHQNLTISMINTLEQQKQKERELKVESLLKRVEFLEHEKSQKMYADYYNSFIAQNYNPNKINRVSKKARISIINEEKIALKRKEMLTQAEKRSQLMRAIGINENDDIKLGIPTIDNGTLISDQEMIKTRLRNLDKNRGKKQKILKPIQKFKGIARALRAWFYIKNYTKKNSAKIRQELVTFMKYDINLHFDVGRVWILQCARPVLLSVFYLYKTHI